MSLVHASAASHAAGVGKCMLSKANWMKKMYGYYFRNFQPLNPGFPTVVKHGVKQNEFAISASFCTNGAGIPYERSAPLWKIVCNPAETTSKDVLMSMTSYYDAYNREKMWHDIWDQRRNPNCKKRSTYKKGFKSDRRMRDFRDAVNVFNHHIDNPFENNDDFVPLKSDDEDEKAKLIEPEMPVLPQMMNLASRSCVTWRPRHEPTTWVPTADEFPLLTLPCRHLPTEMTLTCATPTQCRGFHETHAMQATSPSSRCRRTSTTRT